MKKISYAGYRFPPEIIQQAIWLFVRFTLSFCDVADLWRNVESLSPTRRSAAGKFLSTHAAVFNIFNVQRHLTTAQTHRRLRAAAMSAWHEAVATA
jgi:transposase-like protein